MDRSGSIRGIIIRELLADVTSTAMIGKKIKNGEFRKHPIEPPWKCPSGYQMNSIKLDQFEMELLEPDEVNTEKVVLQLHGGGYIGPMKNVYRTFAVNYSQAGKGIRVLTIDYRVAPENPYPAALEDAIEAYRYLLALDYPADRIIVAGDSAGGGLALALCHYAKDNNMPLPGGIITMSAWTDLALEGESYEKNFEIDPLFGNTTDSLIYNNDYVGEHDPKDPYISPLYGDFTGFPPMLMQVGTHEMLLSDTVSVAEKAKADMVKVKISIYEGMFHVFQMAGMLIPESKKAWNEVERFMKRI